MEIQRLQNRYQPQTSFQASVSPQIKALLYKQLRVSPAKKKMAQLLEEQLKNIEKWGSSDSEIVRAKDYRGQYRLGICYNVVPTLKFTWAIKRPLSKTELSQFLSLKESDIVDTENSIKYLYAKYGSGLFNRYK